MGIGEESSTCEGAASGQGLIDDKGHGEAPRRVLSAARDGEVVGAFGRVADCRALIVVTTDDRGGQDEEREKCEGWNYRATPSCGGAAVQTRCDAGEER